MADGNDSSSRAEKAFEFVKNQLAMVVDWRDSQFRVLFFAKQLPRDDV